MTKTEKIRRKMATVDNSLGKIETILRDHERGHRKLDCRKVVVECAAVKAAMTQLENLL